MNAARTPDPFRPPDADVLACLALVEAALREDLDAADTLIRLADAEGSGLALLQAALWLLIVTVREHTDLPLDGWIRSARARLIVFAPSRPVRPALPGGQ